VASLAYDFAGKNVAAARAARQQAARLVTDVSASTRTALNALVVRAIREQIPPAQLATLIRDLIGLTEPQVHAALSYRKTLEDSGVSRPRIKLLMERYTARQLRRRAMMIARTEVMDALNTGQLRSWQDARDAGVIGKRAKKELIATPGACERTCAPLDGKRFALDAVITRGRKNPPFHPHCRCAIALVP
jgi:SPP1 gp7 family putative phage head morphogenesis protein